MKQYYFEFISPSTGGTLNFKVIAKTLTAAKKKFRKEWDKTYKVVSIREENMLNHVKGYH